MRVESLDRGKRRRWRWIRKVAKGIKRMNKRVDEEQRRNVLADVEEGEGENEGSRKTRVGRGPQGQVFQVSGCTSALAVVSR